MKNCRIQVESSFFLFYFYQQVESSNVAAQYKASSMQVKPVVKQRKENKSIYVPKEQTNNTSLGQQDVDSSQIILNNIVPATVIHKEVILQNQDSIPQKSVELQNISADAASAKGVSVGSSSDEFADMSLLESVHESSLPTIQTLLPLRMLMLVLLQMPLIILLLLIIRFYLNQILIILLYKIVFNLFQERTRLILLSISIEKKNHIKIMNK